MIARGLQVDLTGLDAGVAKLEALGPALRIGLRETVERQAILLQRHVVAEKLHGQVLHVRSGTLARSITYRVEESAGVIRGIVGTNVGYGKAHEFGMTLHIPEIRPRNAKALRFMVGGSVVFATRVRAHDVHLPERSFLRSSLKDRAAAFLAAVRETLRRIIKAGR